MSTTQQTKFAVFDIDGTLYRWQLFHELVQELTFAGAFDETVFHEINDRWNKWRGGAMSFDEYESYIVTVLMAELPKLSVELFDATCQKVVAQSRHKTYHYPRQLIADLKAQGYFLIALSGSQQELVDGFAAHYGFDVALGALYERQESRFTGKVIRPILGRKKELLSEIIVTHDLTTTGSIGVGDSEGDIGMLSLVESPTAFNPSSGLFEHAKASGWPIIIERKNIAYRMEHQDNAFVLAETIIY